MKFWKKRETSRSRRNAKVWALRAKQYGLYAGGAGVVLSLAVYGWMTGSFGRAGDWIHEETVALTAKSGFVVGDILVTGRTYISQQQLLAHLDVEAGEPTFGIDLDAAQAKLEQISWVERAVVSRRLPDKIVVDITERKPVALWQYQKKISLIDKEGKILAEAGLGEWKGLPLVVGEDAPEFTVELLQTLQAEPAVMEQLASAVRIGNRRWDLHLKNGIVVKLPEENAEFALSQLAADETKNQLFEKNIAAIDMRIPDRFVVEVKPDSGKLADSAKDDKQKKKS